MSKEKIYEINYEMLSNDKLLEIWATKAAKGDELKLIESLLKQRNVIREIRPNEKRT